MADVILFHHALGLTEGVQDFARRLRAAEHRVTVPDLYQGQTFETVEAGVEHAQKTGFDEILRRGVAAAAEMPAACVYAGFSLGVMPAQKLAQTRHGAIGALLYHSLIPVSEFGPAWPDGVALQVHVTERDKWEDLSAIRQIAEGIPGSELLVYPGSAHLAADSSFGEYDAAIAEVIVEKSIEFLDRLSNTVR
jgi:dienelactone hydrolase